MPTRRHVLSAAALGAAALATSRIAGAQQRPGDLLPTLGPVGRRELPRNPAGGRFRPPTKLGLGGGPAGNNWEPIPDQQVRDTVQAAWDSGVRYFDNSPWYGLGLSERRFGSVLHQLDPDEYVISTKVGRLLTAADAPPKVNWKDPPSFDYRYDYSAAGARRSVEDSLQRMGIPRIDIVFIHDLAPNNREMGERWTEHFAEAERGAIPELEKMRAEGLIRAWGLGVNHPEPALRALEAGDPDIMLLACQYSILDHAQALRETFPRLAARGVSVVVGSPLSAGYVVGRERYLYDGTIPDWAPRKRERLHAIAARHGIDARTAALQFAAAPEVVSAVIPGARTPEQARENTRSMQVAVPADFWAELKRERLVEQDAPVPA
ncbi:aldo/keto reductase [Luteimonas sp. Y-2-2-4F]|nr:aldo/keto reductase [Luteimonas sp. Y-2-2-4F]MCD9032217.1 aldo/keto reductase [Luteimonas sp. Y-2-2-4F]